MKNNLYLEAPNYHRLTELYNNTCVFLGGSITGACNWQIRAKEVLLPYFNVINPRREDYNTLDPKLEREQISWEFFYLNKCDIILFYFAPETLAPITLFELGKFLGRFKYNHWQKTYIVIHPEYKRKNDVIIQTELECPELAKNISFSLDKTLKQIIKENS